MNTPIFIYDKDKAIDNYQTIQDYCDIVSYSNKTNPTITTILQKQTDSYFSVHLPNETNHINDPTRIIYLAQGWTRDDIKQRINDGITWFVVDNHKDLTILKDYLKIHDDTIHVSLRMKLKEYTLQTEKYFVFGMPSQTINEEIQSLHDHPNIDSLGIHFHRKTQNITEWSYTKQLQRNLDDATLNALDHVNIGGGIPSHYANTNQQAIPSVLDKIQTITDWLNQQDVTTIIEPGRYIAATPVTLKTTIQRIYDDNIIIDASIYQGNMDAQLENLKLQIKEEHPDGTPYTVKGKTPCSQDIFRYKTYLKNPTEGDTLTLQNAGAYNFKTDFCNLPQIPKTIQ